MILPAQKKPAVTASNLLTAQQQTACEGVARGLAPHSQRARMLLILNQSGSQAEAAEQTGLSPGQVKYWLARFRKQGLSIFNETRPAARVDSTAKPEAAQDQSQIAVKKIQTSKTPTLVRSVVKPPEEPKLSEGQGVIKVKAPLPGNIIQVLKQAGDKVVLGDLVLMYEAMKMENKVLAEADGIIKSMKAKVGDAVLQGDVLFEIE